MFKTSGDLLKYALAKKVLIKDNLFTIDEQVLAKIKFATDKDDHLKLLFDRANNKFKFKSSNKNNYDLHSLCKSRVVDPLFLENKKLKRVSEIDSEFLKLKEKYSKPKEYYIKFLERRN